MRSSPVGKLWFVLMVCAVLVMSVGVGYAYTHQAEMVVDAVDTWDGSESPALLYEDCREHPSDNNWTRTRYGDWPYPTTDSYKASALASYDCTNAQLNLADKYISTYTTRGEWVADRFTTKLGGSHTTTQVAAADELRPSIWVKASASSVVGYFELYFYPDSGTAESDEYVFFVGWQEYSNSSGWQQLDLQNLGNPACGGATWSSTEVNDLKVEIWGYNGYTGGEACMDYFVLDFFDP